MATVFTAPIMSCVLDSAAKQCCGNQIGKLSMCTKEEVDEALQVLRDNDRVIAVTETAMDGGTMIPVDGIPRTPEEICEMAERLKNAPEWNDSSPSS